MHNHFGEDIALTSLMQGAIRVRSRGIILLYWYWEVSIDL